MEKNSSEGENRPDGRKSSSAEGRNYHRRRSFRSSPSHHESENRLRIGEKGNRSREEDRTGRKRRSDTSYPKSPVRKRSYNKCENYNKRRSSHSRPSRYKSDRCSGRIGGRNRDYEEDRSGRRRHFHTDSSESPVGKRFKRDGNYDYYKERTLPSYLLRQRSDESRNYEEEDARNDRYDQYENKGCRRIDYNSDDSGGSFIRRRERVPDRSLWRSSGVLFRDGKRSLPILPAERIDPLRTPTPEGSNYRRWKAVNIDPKVPAFSMVKLDRNWVSESGNQTTMYTLDDLDKDLENPPDSAPPNFVSGYEYEKTRSYKAMRKLAISLMKSGEEGASRMKGDLLPLVFTEDQLISSPERDGEISEQERTFSPIRKKDVPHFLYSKRLSLEVSEPKKKINGIGRHYIYESGPVTYPVSYEDTLKYRNTESSSPTNDSTSNVAYDPITKSILSKGIVFRSFEQVNDPINDPDSCIFSFKSYNILSQKAAMSHLEMYTHLTIPKDDGTVSIKKSLLQSDRYGKLLDELITYQTDIMCLQGCDESFYFNTLYSRMEKFGFKGEFLLKRSSNSTDGCAVFYSNKFKLIHKKDICFSDFISSSDVTPHVAQILEFEVNSKDTQTTSGKTHLFVANADIIYEPKRCDLKLFQLSCLLANLQDMIGKCSNPYGYIMCGNFNMQPHSEIYNLILHNKCSSYIDRTTFSGQIPEDPNDDENFRNYSESKLGRESLFDHTSTLVSKERGRYFGDFTHRLLFASAYQHYRCTEETFEPEICRYNTCAASNPDYIFYGVNKRELYMNSIAIDETAKLSLLKRLSLPTVCEIAQNLGPMPNSLTGSDHLPLVAHFQLR